MDRGQGAKKIFNLVIQLEIESEKDGGKVHVISFLPPEYIKKKEKEFREKKEDSSPKILVMGRGERF
jgi:hypothetical protein